MDISALANSLWNACMQKEVKNWVRVMVDVERAAGPARTQANPREAVAITTLQRASDCAHASCYMEYQRKGAHISTLTLVSTFSPASAFTVDFFCVCTKI